MAESRTKGSFREETSYVPAQLDCIFEKLQVLERQNLGLSSQLKCVNKTLSRMEGSTRSKVSLQSTSSQDTTKATFDDSESETSTLKPPSSDDSKNFNHQPPPHQDHQMMVSTGIISKEGGFTPPHVLALRKAFPWLLVEMDVSDDLLDDLSTMRPPLFTDTDVESIRKEKRSSERCRRVIRKLQALTDEYFRSKFLPVMAKHQDHVADHLWSRYERLQGEQVPECLACTISRQLSLCSVADALYSKAVIDGDNMLYITSDHIPPQVCWDYIYTLLSRTRTRHTAWSSILSAVPNGQESLLEFLKGKTEKDFANMKCRCNFLFRKQISLDKCQKWVSENPLQGPGSESSTNTEDSQRDDPSHKIEKAENISTAWLDSEETAIKSLMKEEEVVNGDEGHDSQETISESLHETPAEVGVEEKPLLSPTTEQTTTNQPTPFPDEFPFDQENTKPIQPLDADAHIIDGYKEETVPHAVPLHASDNASVSGRTANTAIKVKSETKHPVPTRPKPRDCRAEIDAGVSPPQSGTEPSGNRTHNAAHPASQDKPTMSNDAAGMADSSATRDPVPTQPKPGDCRAAIDAGVFPLQSGTEPSENQTHNAAHPASQDKPTMSNDAAGMADSCRDINISLPPASSDTASTTVNNSPKMTPPKPSLMKRPTLPPKPKRSPEPTQEKQQPVVLAEQSAAAVVPDGILNPSSDNSQATSGAGTKGLMSSSYDSNDKQSKLHVLSSQQSKPQPTCHPLGKTPELHKEVKSNNSRVKAMKEKFNNLVG